VAAHGVGAGGMIFELAVAAAPAHYWIATLSDSGSMGHKLAFNAMFTASVTTVLFNANPLMRFDGYYILSDLLEIPNMMQRSTKMLQHLAQKYIYRVEQTRPPATTTSEQVTLVIYGVLAMAYRVFLFFSITLYMMGKLFALGLILAVWTAAAWFILPIGKFIHWLATSPQLAEFRARAILTSLVLIAVGVIGLGLVPVPDRYRVSGVVQSEARSGVFFETDGFVTKAHVQPGDFVKKGDPIVTCESDDMTSRMALAEAQLREYESLERQYTRDSPAAAVIARERLANQQHLISEVGKRIDGLVLRAPHDGVVVLGVPRHEPADGCGCIRPPRADAVRDRG
jgi:putative peptide zinc metalloprotease protein